ncbi:MAG: Fic family protein [Boseongicola sp. SB0662_bin_57]|nr:Fic family protein [Boseongicola sp. SB0662_bin_57]
METSAKEQRFSGPVSVFLQRRLPETAKPVGYGALIDAFDLKVPVPIKLMAIGARHRVIDTGTWKILTPRHDPHASLRGHVRHALKYEGLDLAVLKRLFVAIGPEPIAEWNRDEPTGGYARRIWFLYEWLIGDFLDLPDAVHGRYVPVLDDLVQFGTEGTNSPRHRVRNNLPGTPDFCPLVFRTEELRTFCARDLAARVREIAEEVPRDLLARTAAFLLLEDSRSSYAIEGEHPPQSRIQRWGRAIGEAGQHELDRAEFLRLQRIVIGDERFVRLGFRQEGGFVGTHDRRSQMPQPDHVSARQEDLDALVDGVIAFARTHAHALDPVVAAAVLAFGFVYIHPFEDGNGRLHRYLFHHVLAERGYSPPDVVFPISATILERIGAYRDVLESHSSRLLPLVDWRATDNFNVEVTNDTGDFYRFFDATPHAAFLYGCVQKAIDVDVPQETRFLRRYDRFRAAVDEMFDMPARTVDLLFRFMRQNDGRLSVRERRKEFAALTDAEVTRVEEVYREQFMDDELAGIGHRRTTGL